jgi:hypothetical protein
LKRIRRVVAASLARGDKNYAISGGAAVVGSRPLELNETGLLEEEAVGVATSLTPEDGEEKAVEEDK